MKKVLIINGHQRYEGIAEGKLTQILIDAALDVVKGWKVIVAYPNECHSCRLCAIDCHVDAITVTHELHIPAPFLNYQRA